MSMDIEPTDFDPWFTKYAATAHRDGVEIAKMLEQMSDSAVASMKKCNQAEAVISASMWAMIAARLNSLAKDVRKRSRSI